MTRTLFLLPALVAVAATVPPPKEAGEKLPPPTAEQLRASVNNLKQIVLAMHNYHDANNAFPNNTFTKDGKPLLSWRVHLLPFMEQDVLYKKFKLDEPWDSTANKALVAELPKVYAPVRVKGKDGHTYYRGFDGPGTVFEKGKKVGLFAITDGTSNTIAVVEAGESVEWTKPDDLPFAADKDVSKLGGLFDGAFHVGLCDGSVRKAKADADSKVLKLMIGRSDGMVFNPDSVFDR